MSDSPRPFDYCELVVEGVKVVLQDGCFAAVDLRGLWKKFVEVRLEQFVASGGMTDPAWSRVVLEGDYSAFVNTKRGAFAWVLRPLMRPYASAPGLRQSDFERDVEELQQQVLAEKSARRAASLVTALDVPGESNNQNNLLVVFILTGMRERWGAAEQIQVDGFVGARALIPVDQFATKQAMEVPAPTLDRAARKYFND